MTGRTREFVKISSMPGHSRTDADRYRPSAPSAGVWMPSSSSGARASSSNRPIAKGHTSNCRPARATTSDDMYRSLKEVDAEIDDLSTKIGMLRDEMRSSMTILWALQQKIARSAT
ncbi:t-SNARE coiled-coil homology domain-containing protein [Plasmodiophora brassicae]|uniref:Uncharacterized protein n=1 Tax=Plasmodiophora brassicae TaxID=37360 RepID=A0A0G4J791_PLABS|nr:hypothetical protein PBRA_009373 [Plasmodiophora brassicae]